MVDPSRIRHCITGFHVDEKNSDGVLVYVDVMVAGDIRWTLEWNVKHRRFLAYCGNNMSPGLGVRYISLKLQTFIISLVPEEILSRCLAVSLGVSIKQTRNHAKVETNDRQ